MTKDIRKRSAAWVSAAIARAREYAVQQGVPLTAERLAAELGMAAPELCRLVAEGDAHIPDRLLSLLRAAYEEANASVVEHAMKRGTGANMHLMYLKQHAGYSDKAVSDGGTVIFTGEDRL